MNYLEKKIFPTITTTKGSNWKNKIEETKELGIEEICLFLTVLNKKERKDIYKLIKKSKIKKIPFIHLKNDIEPEEIDYLIKMYDVRVFNIHTEREFPLVSDYSKYRKNIYIENIFYPLSEKELNYFAGICLDFAHLENDRILKKEKFFHNLSLTKKYKVGCNHISAIKKEVSKDYKGHIRCDSHFFEDLSEFDYLKKYPLRLFSPFNALELENNIKEQLRAKEYIINLLK